MSDRRNRTDGAAGATEIMQGALSGPPSPPAGVTISEPVKPFWKLVTTAKAKRAWTQSDLVLAAEVARCMYRLEVLSQHLENNLVLILAGDEEGKDTKEAEKLADTLAKRIRLLNAHLQIHPEATQGKSREQPKQNKAHKEAVEGAAKGGDEDGLIPGVTH